MAAKNFLPFFVVVWTSAFSDVANCHQSQKVKHMCTTTNLPLANGIKIVSVLQLYSVLKSGAQTLTFKSVTDKQTDNQTKNSTFLATPAAGEIRALPNLARHGDRGPRARSCTSETFGSLSHSFAARGF